MTVESLHVMRVTVSGSDPVLDNLKKIARRDHVSFERALRKAVEIFLPKGVTTPSKKISS